MSSQASNGSKGSGSKGATKRKSTQPADAAAAASTPASSSPSSSKRRRSSRSSLSNASVDGAAAGAAAASSSSSSSSLAAAAAAAAEPASSSRLQPRHRHVLIVLKDYDPFYTEVRYASHELDNSGIAELLSDNRALLQLICDAGFDSRVADTRGQELVRTFLCQHAQRTGKQALAPVDLNDLPNCEHDGACAWRSAATVQLHNAPVPDFRLLLLHQLRDLYDWAEANKTHVAVSVLPQHALNFVARLGQLSDADARTHASFTSLFRDFAHVTPVPWHPLVVREDRQPAHEEATRTESRTTQARHLEADAQPRMADADSDWLSFRLCATFLEAVTPEPEPRILLSHVDAVYLPSLMWYAAKVPELGRQSCREELALGLQRACDIAAGMTNGTLRPSILPSLRWEEHTELKNRMYTTFQADMLHSQWIDVPPAVLRCLLSEPDNAGGVAALQQMCEQLIKHIPARTYMLKGAWADGKSCVTQMSKPAGSAAARAAAVAPAPASSSASAASASSGRQRAGRPKQDPLVKMVKEMVLQHGQRCLGVQPFDPDLPKSEFRWWVTAPDPIDGGAPRWKRSLCIESVYKGPTIAARLNSAEHPVGAVTAHFVDKLLDNHAPFFQRALELGMRALRVDCWYSHTHGKVLLNEITLPLDAMIFSYKHHSPLLPFLAQCAATLITDAIQMHMDHERHQREASAPPQAPQPPPTPPPPPPSAADGGASTPPVAPFTPPTTPAMPSQPAQPQQQQDSSQRQQRHARVAAPTNILADDVTHLVMPPDAAIAPPSSQPRATEQRWRKHASPEEAKEQLCINSNACGFDVVEVAVYGRALRATRAFAQGAMLGHMYGLLVDEGTHKGWTHLRGKALDEQRLSMLEKHGEDFVTPLTEGLWRVVQTAEGLLLASAQCPMSLINHDVSHANCSLDLTQMHCRQLLPHQHEWLSFPVHATRDVAVGELLLADYGWSPEQWDMQRKQQRAAAH